MPVVVFVRKVRTASGATAVQLADRVGGRDKVIDHLGSAHTHSDLAVLLETARGKLHAGQGELDLGLGAQDPREAIVRGQASAVLVEVIAGAWRRFGFDIIADDAFFQLVLARVVEPTSKADSVRVLRELGVAPAHRNTFTATLRRCAQRGYRDLVAAACFSHASTAGIVPSYLGERGENVGCAHVEWHRQVRPSLVSESRGDNFVARRLCSLAERSRHWARQRIPT